MKTNESILFVIVILAFLVFAALIILNYESGRTQTIVTPPNRSTLVISASGTVYNRSSQADLSVDVNGTGLTSADAVQNISATLATFNSTILRYVNRNLSYLSTTYFNAYKLYNKTGYGATESLTVTIPNINNVSGAIGAISNIPNVYVTYANPSLSDAQISAMRVTALSLALSNATAQAHALIGNNAILATNISVNNYYIYPFTYALGAASSSGGGGIANQKNITVPPQFYGGLNKITESVTVVFIYNSTMK